MIQSRNPAVALGLALAVIACGPGASPSPSPSPAPSVAPSPSPAPSVEPSPSPSPEPVAEKCSGQKMTFLLSFFGNVQHAGFLVAQVKGYYAAEGLEVDIQQGGPGVSVVSAVGDGSVNAGQVDYGELLRARASDVPIKAIGQTYQKSFIILFALKTSGIASVADWKGKRVGQIQVGDNPERDAMILSAGFTPADVTLVEQDFAVDVFNSGAEDVGTGVVFFHPAAFNLFGGHAWPDEFNIFTPDDNGAPISSQSIAVNEEFLAADPAALRCFLRASLRGWRDAFADPKATVDAIFADTTYKLIDPAGFPPPHQELAISDVLAIVGTGADDPNLLRIDPQRYQQSIDILKEVGYLASDVNVADTYTTEIYDTMGPIE